MDYLSTLSKMAICQWQLNNVEQAQAHFNESINNYLFLVENTFKSMSETEKSKFWQTLKPRVETFMSFAISNADKNPSVRKRCGMKLKPPSIRRIRSALRMCFLIMAAPFHFLKDLRPVYH